MLAVSLGVLALSAGQAQATTVSFTEPGCSTTWTVPAGVSAVRITATGAAGEPGRRVLSFGSPSVPSGAGGAGGVVSATLSGLEAGEVLGVCVNQGWGDGGPDPDGGAGGQGGGLSGVTRGSEPVLIAAGGGGGGDGGRYGSDQPGGAAGLPGGAPGADGLRQPGALGGGGGSQTQGGTGGAGDSVPASCGPYCGSGSSGTAFDPNALRSGGNGGQIVTVTGGGGGGGGAGYYGGGGGGSGGTPCDNCNSAGSGGAGGGGGSDFCAASLLAATLSGCAATGSNSSPTTASVVFTYPVAPPAVSIAVPASGASYAQGQAVSSSFSCDDGAGGSWLVSCVDQSGRPSGSLLDTSTRGSHTFTVTATTRDGMTGTASVTYQVLPGGGGGVNPAAVTVAGLHATTLKFHVGDALARFSRNAPTGTTISFNIDGSASVTFTFNQLLPGKRSGRRCVAPKPRLKHARSCSRRVAKGTLSFNATSGSHRLFFDGRLSRRKTLRPGSYELSVTATANGVSSKAQKLRFALLPRLNQ